MGKSCNHQLPVEQESESRSNHPNDILVIDCSEQLEIKYETEKMRFML